MRKPLLLLLIIVCVVLAASTTFWLSTSPSLSYKAKEATTISDASAPDSHDFRNELIARGLANYLSDPSTDKNSVLEKFCLSFRETGAAHPSGSDWVGHSLISNPYGIHFTYEDAQGTIIATTRGDAIWRDQHRPSQEDLLRIQRGRFTAAVHLTEGESASIYFYFFGE